MKQLPAAFIAEKNKTVNPSAWVWCFKIQVDADSDEGFWITTNNEAVTIGADTYDPYPVELDNLTESLTGLDNELDINVEDINGDFAYYLLSGDGIVGNLAVITIVNLEDTTAYYTLEYKIVSCKLDNTKVRITVTSMNTADPNFRNLTYQRDFCRWDFTSTECGVNPLVPSPGQICTKRLQGSFGCEDWGDREALAGYTKKHPLRFGAFPSLTTGRAYEV